jgi:hypothetical protein
VAAWARVEPAVFRAKDLRLHALLEGVPLHDVWRIDLPGGPDGLDLRVVRELMMAEDVVAANPVVRGLFALRGLLGRIFRLDPEAASPQVAAESYLHRLTPEDRAASLEPPGSHDGPFRVLYVFADEAVSEIRNKTVHAFSAVTFERSPAGYTAHWAIYVLPVGSGWLTACYMALIDPFRRLLVYPAMLGRIHRLWLERMGT